MKRLNIIYQEKFKVTRRKTLLKSHSLKQGKNTVKLQLLIKKNTIFEVQVLKSENFDIYTLNEIL